MCRYCMATSRPTADTSRQAQTGPNWNWRDTSTSASGMSPKSPTGVFYRPITETGCAPLWSDYCQMCPSLSDDQNLILFWCRITALAFFSFSLLLHWKSIERSNSQQCPLSIRSHLSSHPLNQCSHYVIVESRVVLASDLHFFLYIQLIFR